ncbi:MAG TPA: GNAT family N-acetyltransferase, partial [Pilimelia sp.]|nr:GNAT family N-acetyltransferase [Pilimelia sp.]
RKRLIGDYVAGLPGGPPRDGGFAAFAAAVGAVPALAEVRRRLDVTEVDEADLAAVLADAYRHAAGYTVVGWTGATPEEYLADVAYLDGRMSIDSPMGDLAWEPEKVDADRIRASDEVQLRWGRVYHTTVAVHVATGQVVAWSGLSFEDGVPWHAWQQNTIVEERHRGHRLGTIVKIENLRRARAAEPGLRFIDTLNAAENTHMIAINEALGFRPVDAWHDWQQDL